MVIQLSLAGPAPPDEVQRLMPRPAQIRPHADVGRPPHVAEIGERRLDLPLEGDRVELGHRRSDIRDHAGRGVERAQAPARAATVHYREQGPRPRLKVQCVDSPVADGARARKRQAGPRRQHARRLIQRADIDGPGVKQHVPRRERDPVAFVTLAGGAQQREGAGGSVDDPELVASFSVGVQRALGAERDVRHLSLQPLAVDTWVGPTTVPAPVTLSMVKST